MHNDLTPIILLAVWFGGSLSLGLGRAIWCGYTGDESEASEAFIFVLWPAILLLVIPAGVIGIVLSAPFHGAHWIGRAIAKRRAEGAGA